MSNNKVKEKIIYIFANIVLLIIIAVVYGSAEKAATMFWVNKVYIYSALIGLLLFIFGLLTEYSKILEAIRIGFTINKVLFVMAIVMLIVSCLPVGFAIPINIRLCVFLSYKAIRYIFSIWSGILLARSLVFKS